MAQRLLCVSIALAGLAFATSSRAAEQPVMSDPAAISSCLCLERSVAIKSDEMKRLQTVYEQAAASLASQNAEIEARRPKVEVDNPFQVEAFRDRLIERDKANELFQTETTPDYQHSVAAYNQEVGAYTNSCSGRSFDATVLQSVKASLSCPAK